MSNSRLLFFALFIFLFHIFVSERINYEFLFIIFLICFLYKNLYSKKNIKSAYRQLEILIPIINRLDIIKALPKTNALNDYAASPDFLHMIIDIIDEKKPNLIIEAGSGVSTLIASYALKKYNPSGKIISFDNDEFFANVTIKEIKTHKLEKYSEIIYSDLIQYPDYNFNWYNINKIEFKNKIDLIIIDGPPSKLDKFARYPAIPLLFKYMNDQAIIILDDARRKSEQQIINRWKMNFSDFNFQYFDNDKGVCIIKKK